MKPFDYDAVILGGGSAGYAAARTAAGAGLKTAVIEGGEEVGGLCILRGCMPTKALLYAAEVMHLAGHAGPWGIRAGKVGFDFKKVMARKNALIKDFADYRRQQLASGKFKFIRARARFLDAHTIKLSSGKTFTAAHFIITTGSAVAPPPLPQLRETGYLTSDDALALKRLPKVAHRPGWRGDCLRIRAILRALWRQGHAHPAQRTHFARIRHRCRGGN